MRKFFFVWVFIPFFAFAQTGYEPKAKGELIRHTYFSLDYNEAHEQPNWVYYMLTSDLINGNVKRKDNFRADNKVTTGSATLSDYKGSGYDRGHLCPAADMKISAVAMSETFFLSNMSPQVSSFNRNKWAALEDQIRNYVRDTSDTLYVVTGPVFVNNKGSIGKNNVTVPGFYYKAVYCPQRGGIGFLMPNDEITEELRSWVVSIDLLEAVTGIDFFYQLEDEYEKEIESQVILWSDAIRIAEQSVTSTSENIDKSNSSEDTGKDYEKIKEQFNTLLIVSVISVSLLLLILIFVLLRRNRKGLSLEFL
jgi:endonuclease G